MNEMLRAQTLVLCYCLNTALPVCLEAKLNLHVQGIHFSSPLKMDGLISIYSLKKSPEKGFLSFCHVVLVLSNVFSAWGRCIDLTEWNPIQNQMLTPEHCSSPVLHTCISGHQMWCDMQCLCGLRSWPGVSVAEPSQSRSTEQVWLRSTNTQDLKHCTKLEVRKALKWLSLVVMLELGDTCTLHLWLLVGRGTVPYVFIDMMSSSCMCLNGIAVVSQGSFWLANFCVLFCYLEIDASQLLKWDNNSCIFALEPPGTGEGEHTWQPVPAAECLHTLQICLSN